MASSSSDQTPISPIKFTRPELTISAAAINNEPIELDGTSISPDELRLARRGSKADALAALEAEKGLSRAERERRAKLILERKSNPAVLVDIPQAPAPDELEQAGAAQDEDGAGTGTLKKAGKA
ncbi:hypothetical protein M409DRAFT_25477 [Zasmidium cellare ATCC 36951]|uniref:Uncharacterized protein n=1 Tax=Zasmidium cellare ATCC 36951 TaxID=1080233 RepID=A0A6A6CD46_ZASCE|nr:uncharacterized protein M409DRAFT_25477 [Zasmidium cellare ATCC 36951]KAF2164130.1 hypothetical protein M409DRAFT_25477 [Zasmidium cellare ATCC 36951]